MNGKSIFIAISAISGSYAGFQVFNMGVFLISCSILFLILSKNRNMVVFTLCLIFFLGFFFYSDYVNHKKSILSPKMNQFSGKITSIPNLNGDKISFQLTLPENEKIMVQYKLKSKNEVETLEALNYGMYCSFKARLYSPSIAKNFYAFNYKDYLKQQAIYWIARPYSLSVNSCYTKKFIGIDHLIRLRENGMDFINDNFHGESKGIANALLFGSKIFVKEETYEAYQRLGIVHLLAISGLHVGLITGLLYFLLLRLGVVKEVSMHILLIIIPIYIIMTGASSPVLRAGLMMMLVLLFKKCKVPIHPIDTISIICIVLIGFDPFLIFDIGFQLSFVVSVSLILSTNKLLMKPPINWWRLLFWTTLIAQLSSAPILLVNFYEISIISLLINIIYIPFITFLILPLLLFIYCIHWFIPLISTTFIPVFSIIIEYVHQWLNELGQWPFFVLSLGKPNFHQTIGYIFSIILFFITWERFGLNRRTYFSSSILVTVFVVHMLSPYFTSTGEVVVLDVGQGDSILIQLPFNQGNFLIDTGGDIKFEKENWQRGTRNFDIGDDIIVPFLKAKGIREINKLILTHGDLDHIGGTAEIIKQMKIKEILISYGGITSQSEMDLITVISEKGIPLKMVKAGNSFREGSYHFYFLAPVDNEVNENDQSIVIFAVLGGIKWLFTGDLEEYGERKLIKNYPGLKADVIKVAHHGSKTSTSDAFLNYLQPSIAIISAGENNRYRHPHNEVIDRLTKRNIRIFRTDLNGAVKFRFQKNNGTFVTKIP